AMETPSLGMPQNPRSTKTGMAPPPNTEPPPRPHNPQAQGPHGPTSQGHGSEGATSQGQGPDGAGQGEGAPPMKATLPLGAVLPQLAAQRAAAVPLPAPPSSMEIMKLTDSDPDEDDPTKIGERSP